MGHEPSGDGGPTLLSGEDEAVEDYAVGDAERLNAEDPGAEWLFSTGENDASRYRLLGLISDNGRTSVWSAVTRENGKIVVLKRVAMTGTGDRADPEPGVPYSALREVALLRQLQHDHIVPLLDVTLTQSHMYLIMEHMSTDLGAYLALLRTSRNRLSRGAVRQFMFQLMRAVEHCHARGIIHRDLKPQNVLLSPEEGVLKVADFDSARAHVMTDSRLTPENICTQWYRPPEVLLAASYGPPMDIWSAGCVFAEMVTGLPVFAVNVASSYTQLDRIFQVMGTPSEYTWPGVTGLPNSIEQFPEYPTPSVFLDNLITPNDLEPSGMSLLKSMLVLDPSKRLTAREALGHEWFQNRD